MLLLLARSLLFCPASSSDRAVGGPVSVSRLLSAALSAPSSQHAAPSAALSVPSVPPVAESRAGPSDRALSLRSTAASSLS